MPRVAFTRHLQRHVTVPSMTVPGQTVGEVLEGVFAAHPSVRGYLMEDNGGLRKHIALFVDSEPVSDRQMLSDTVADDAEVFVMQALSGG